MDIESNVEEAIAIENEESIEDEELPGMLALFEKVSKQEWPHTMDASIWADKWFETLQKHPEIHKDKGTMIGWFANAIMAGYDTAVMRCSKGEN